MIGGLFLRKPFEIADSQYQLCPYFELPDFQNLASVGLHSPSALPPSCKFKVKPTILTKRKHTIYTPTSKDGDPNMDGTTYNNNNNCTRSRSMKH